MAHWKFQFDKSSHSLPGGSIDSQDSSRWPIMEPLPSYGQGQDLPGQRHHSLINGYNLTDVVITGDNGAIDGQGLIWWEWFNSQTLNYSRPHILKLVNSTDGVISNLTFLNSSAWSIHLVYSNKVEILSITVHAASESPFTNGIVPAFRKETRGVGTGGSSVQHSLTATFLHSILLCQTMSSSSHCTNGHRQVHSW